MLDVPDGELEKALAERAKLCRRARRQEAARAGPPGRVLDPLPDEGLGDLERCLVSGEDEGRAAAEDAFEDEPDQRIVGAPEDDRVDAGAPKRRRVGANRSVDGRRRETAGLDHRHERRARDGDDLAAGVQLVDRLRVAVALDGRIGGEDADPAIPSCLDGGMGLRGEDADDGDGELALEVGKRRRRGRVAGRHDQLDLLALEVSAELEREAPDLVRGTRPVGTARAVAEVDEVLVRHRDEALVEDGQAARARVEDPDGPRIHAASLRGPAERQDPDSVTPVLELDKAEGAFETLEAYLDDAGFYGRLGIVADLYLGYGLSRTLRRTAVPSPPEPCALPLLACRLRPEDEPESVGGPFRIGDWEPTWSEAEYAVAVEAVRSAIARGDVYQVNLVQHLSAPFSGEPVDLAGRLARLGPLHGRPLAGNGWTIVSGSPELLLSRRSDRVWTKPIKGTRPLDAAEELADSAKDAAEHVMIVDLERNDLSRVCVPGTVRWPELLVEHRLAGVSHLVSRVEGQLRPGVGLAELLTAVFPGGSVTGAPKISAVDHIAKLEPVGRGASMGAIGTLRPNGDLDLALTIRTFAVAGGRIHLWVGGGVVWDSDPADEIEESWVKARPLLAALGVPVPEPAPA